MKSGDPYEVSSFNFKKQECVTRLLIPSANGEIKERNIGIHDFKPDTNRLIHIPQPDKTERELIKVLHTQGFYQHPDTDLKERYYTRHLLCACSQNDCRPLVFIVNEDGTLLIKELWHYYGFDNAEYLNPYTIDNLWTIKNAAEQGITFYDNSEQESCLENIKTWLPELYATLAPYL
jgi:hypothetical protein